MSLNPAEGGVKRESYLCLLISRTSCLADASEAAVEALTSKLSGVMRLESKAEREKAEREKAPSSEVYPPLLETLRGVISRIEHSIEVIRAVTEATEV